MDGVGNDPGRHEAKAVATGGLSKSARASVRARSISAPDLSVGVEAMIGKDEYSAAADSVP